MRWPTGTLARKLHVANASPCLRQEGPGIRDEQLGHLAVVSLSNGSFLPLLKESSCRDKINNP